MNDSREIIMKTELCSLRESGLAGISWTVEETADYYKTPVRTVRRMLRNGLLSGVKIAGTFGDEWRVDVRFLPDDLGGREPLMVQLQQRDKVIGELSELLAEAYKELDLKRDRTMPKEETVLEIGKRTFSRLICALAPTSKTA